MYFIAFVVAMPVVQLLLLVATVRSALALGIDRWRTWRFAFLAVIACTVGTYLFATLEPLPALIHSLVVPTGPEGKARQLAESLSQIISCGVIGGIIGSVLYGLFTLLDSRIHGVPKPIRGGRFVALRTASAFLLSLLGWQILFLGGSFTAIAALSSLSSQHRSSDIPAQVLYGLVSALATVVASRAAFRVLPYPSPLLIWSLVIAQGIPAGDTYFKDFFAAPVVAWAITGACIALLKSRGTSSSRTTSEREERTA